MVKFFIALHVLVALGSVGPMIHGVTTASRAIRRNDASSAAYTARLIKVYSVATVLAVILGFALMSMNSPYVPHSHVKLGSFGQTWIWLSVLLWLVAVGMAHALIIPALDKIDGAGDAAPTGVAARVLVFGAVDALALAAIVFLMIYQPGK